MNHLTRNHVPNLHSSYFHQTQCSHLLGSKLFLLHSSSITFFPNICNVLYIMNRKRLCTMHSHSFHVICFLVYLLLHIYVDTKFCKYRKKHVFHLSEYAVHTLRHKYYVFHNYHTHRYYVNLLY